MKSSDALIRALAVVLVEPRRVKESSRVNLVHLKSEKSRVFSGPGTHNSKPPFILSITLTVDPAVPY